MEQVATTVVTKSAKKPTKKKHLSRKASAAIFIACMLFVPLLQFVIFWIVPNINSILLAFTNKTGTAGAGYQFSKFWKDLTDSSSHDHDFLVYSITNSLIYFAVNIFICTPIVLFFSYVLFRKVPLSGVFKVVFYLPSILGLTVTATLFWFLFKAPVGFSAGGPIWTLLEKWGLISEKVVSDGGLFKSPDTAFWMVLIYSIWTCVGLNMIMFNGAMKRIPSEVFESANLDGVGFFRQFISIVVPLIWPTISTLIIFSLSGIFVSYGAVMILTPNTQEASMIGWFILFKTDRNQANDPNYAAAVGLVFTLIGMPFILLIKRGLDKISAAVEY